MFWIMLLGTVFSFGALSGEHSGLKDMPGYDAACTSAWSVRPRSVLAAGAYGVCVPLGPRMVQPGHGGYLEMRAAVPVEGPPGPFRFSLLFDRGQHDGQGIERAGNLTVAPAAALLRGLVSFLFNVIVTLCPCNHRWAGCSLGRCVLCPVSTAPGRRLNSHQGV